MGVFPKSVLAWTQTDARNGFEISLEGDKDSGINPCTISTMENRVPENLVPLLKRLRTVDEGRMADVLEARLGLIDGRAQTLAEIGERQGGYTRERTRQIEIEAFRLIYQFAEETGEADAISATLQKLGSKARAIRRPHDQANPPNPRTDTTRLDDPTFQLLRGHVLVHLNRISKRLENIEAQLQEERRSIDVAIKAVEQIAVPERSLEDVVVATSKTTKIDGRSIRKPEKNLKISARRSFEWSKGDGKPADEARRRAMVVVEKRAEELGYDKVPETVLQYVDAVAREFDKVKPLG
jgi:hypothetical protein